MKSKIAIIVLLISYTVSAQETFSFKDISRHGVYTVVEDTLLVPDYNAEYRRAMYRGKYNKYLAYVIKAYENLNQKLKENPSDTETKASIEKLLQEYKPIFYEIRNKGMGILHFKNVDFKSPNLIEATKKELEKLKGDVVKLEYLSEHDIDTKIPKVNVKMRLIEYLNNSSDIKGEYYIADVIKVATRSRAKDKVYENQVVEDAREIEYYRMYNYFKSVDGSGVDFYNASIDIYNNYAVNKKPKPLTQEEKQVVAKMKSYSSQMELLIDGMSKFTSNLPLARESTVKGKALQKKVNLLYGNDDDKYLDFLQLLDYESIKIMSEFNQVLGGSVRLFGV